MKTRIIEGVFLMKQLSIRSANRRGCWYHHYTNSHASDKGRNLGGSKRSQIRLCLLNATVAKCDRGKLLDQF